MKKIVYGAMAVVMCLGVVSCGSDNNVNKAGEKETGEKETGIVVPEYNTFSMSVDALVSKLNDSGDYTKIWSADCTTQDIGDGKTSFKTNNVIIGSYWNGTYETSSKNIIDITISYPCDNNNAENGLVACAVSEPIMEYLFDIDQDTAMSEWMQASKAGSNGYDYGEYQIYVAYNSTNSSMETIITPNNEIKE